MASQTALPPHRLDAAAGHPGRAGASPTATRFWLVLAAIFLLALLPRVIVAFEFNDPPALTNDAGWYDFFGQQIAGGHGYSLPYGEATSKWPPGYPFFLGAVYKASADSRTAARVAQAVLGALVAVLAAYVAARTVSRAAGVAAGLIVALLPGQALWTSILMSEVLFTFLIMAAIATGVRPRTWAAALSGLAFGTATLVRAQGIVLVLALFAWWWVAGWWRPPLRRATTIRAAVLAATLALTLLPWTARNAVRLHTLAPVSTNLGLNLWMGNNPSATGAVMDAPVTEFERQTAGLANPEKEVREDALARDAALRYIAHHPLTFIARAPKKIFATYRDDRSFVSWYNPPGHAYLTPAVRRHIGALTTIAYTAVLVAAIAGMVMLARARSPAVALPLVAVIAWTAVSVLFFGDTRYVIPIVPLLAVPAGHAVARGWDALPSRRPRPAPVAERQPGA